jgi:hypothetical protein
MLFAEKVMLPQSSELRTCSTGDCCSDPVGHIAALPGGMSAVPCGYAGDALRLCWRCVAAMLAVPCQQGFHAIDCHIPVYDHEQLKSACVLLQCSKRPD